MSESEKKIQDENEEVNDADLISLLDDDGNEYEFEVLDEMEYKDSYYYALMPLFEMVEQDIEPGSTYMIFEAIEDENGESQLAEVEDEDLLDEIAEIFEERFDFAEE